MTTLANKDPSEAKKYTFDFTAWLDALGVTISSLTSVTADSGLTVDNTANTTKKVTAQYSGGTAGNVYKVKATIQTGDSQVLIGAMLVPVENK